MMTNRDPWMARLSEYVDGELPADERLDLDRHLEVCADCRVAVMDVRRVRDLAGALVDAEPPRDLWAGIEARIGGPARVLPLQRRWVLTLPQLAAAAALMIVVGAGGAALALRATGTPEAAGPVAVMRPVGDATLIPVAVVGGASFDQAVTSLGRVLAEHRDRLDPETVRVLEQSLQTIDRAIARAREALATDPNDAYLNAHLAETMRRKLNLMRRATALVAAS
jgi:anti-sigma factor RsiW